MIHNFTEASTHLHFIGVAGTAMGNVAAALRSAGITVTGSDAAVYPPMSDFLQNSGVTWYNGWNPSFLREQQPSAVVVGNAISRGNPELEEALNLRLPLLSMPEVVKNFLIRQHTSIVIAGTHGKTTTSSLTAVALQGAGLPVGFLIGAVVPQFSSGCRPVPAEKGFFVSEGDEYDTAFFDKRSKFLSYRPDIAVINNIEFDHADIFPSLEHLISSFRLFARLVPQTGVLLVGEEHAAARRAVADALAPVEVFGLQESADWRAAECVFTSSGAEFTVLFRERPLAQCTLALAGEHNVRNALAAFAAGYHAGANPQAMAKALADFTPPKRRMEVLVQTPDVTVIDDFAHHPTALEATIAATRQRYPNRRIVLCFEPRSNTTTRNIFQEELATALANADCVYLGALNRPERYSVQEILDVPKLLSAITANGKQAYSVQQQQQEWGKELFAMLQRNFQTGDVILLCSNGDWNGLRQMLSNYFIN